MSKSQKGNTIPKSMRHKRILDVAAEMPDASLDELAKEIPSATTDLVEHVLEEYGDPASDDTTEPSEDDESKKSDEETIEESTDDAAEGPEDDTAGKPADPPDENASAAPDPDEESTTDHSTVNGGDNRRHHGGDGLTSQVPTPRGLSEKQRSTLRAIREHPEATQEELADLFGVSAPTISNRVNSIEGFEWRSRQAFTAAVFGDSDAAVGPQSATDGGELQFDRLAERVTRLERQLKARSTADCTSRAFDDIELLYKVIRACMNSKEITEDEELRILKCILPNAQTPDEGDSLDDRPR